MGLMLLHFLSLKAKLFQYTSIIYTNFFAQNLATIRVLSLSTKFISKRNMRIKKKALTEFKNFRRQRNDKAFFMEKLQALLCKIKSSERKFYFITPVEDTDIKSFCWNLRGDLKRFIKSSFKTSQNLSNQGLYKI